MDIESILKQMTLEDKIALCSGKNFWETKSFEKYGIDAMFMCDGPHGLRKQENLADMLGDCLDAYAALLKTGVSPCDVVFMGESAGGTLVLSLSLLLAEKGPAQPRAHSALSPCVTQAEQLPSYTGNAATDYMLRSSVADGKIKIVYGDRANDPEFLRKSTVSPLYGDFTELPPVVLSVSDTEVLLDDSVALYTKLKAENHQTALESIFEFLERIK